LEIGTYTGNYLNSSSPTLDQSIYVTDTGEVVTDLDYSPIYIFENSSTATGGYQIFNFEVGPDGYWIISPVNANEAQNLIRFVDTTSRIDLVSYKSSFFNSPTSEEIEYTLQVFESDDYLNSATPFWMPNQISGLTEYLFIQRAKRFVKFEIEFFSELSDSYFNGSATPSIEFLLLVEVQISDTTPPNITDSTKDILSKFPSWTKMYEDSTEDATPSLAIPESFGGKFINSLVGNDLDKIESLIDYHNYSKSITGASTDQITWIYAANNCPELVTRVTGDGVELSPISSYSEFISYGSLDYVYYYSPADRVVLTIRPFKSLKINDRVLSQEEVLIFNTFDEFGARVGLSRLKLESNENYKKRILDVYINKPSSDSESFKKTLRRELDLWRALGSTPNSQFAGATPNLYEFQDLEKFTKYFQENGNPTEEFILFINRINREYPTNWGFVDWSNLIWDYAGRLSEGVSNVPFVYDTPFKEATPKYYQPGVGDLSDLVISVDSYDKNIDDEIILNDSNNEKIFQKQAKIRLSGIKKESTKTAYTPINVDLSYFLEYKYPQAKHAATVNYFVEIYSQGTPYYANITDYHRNIAAQLSQISSSTPSRSEANIRQIIKQSDERTDPSITFRNKLNNQLYLDYSATPYLNTISVGKMSNARVGYGHFAYSTTTPRYVINNHSSENLSRLGIKAQNNSYTNPSYIFSKNYANSTTVNPSAPYFELATPNSGTMQVLYGSDMYSFDYLNANTNPSQKTIRLATNASSPDYITINQSTPQFVQSFTELLTNQIFESIDISSRLATPTFLHVHNAKPDFAKIRNDATPPFNLELSRYGGYTVNPQFLSSSYVPTILLRTNTSTDEVFSTPKYDLSSTPNNIIFYWDPNYSTINNQYTIFQNNQKTAFKNYPTVVNTWGYFEYESSTPIVFNISQRGIISSEDDLNESIKLDDIVLNRDIHRYEFSQMNLSTPSQYVVHSIEAIKVDKDDDSFEVYTDKSTVKPLYSISQEQGIDVQSVNYKSSNYYSEAVQGAHDDVYIEGVTIRSRLASGVNSKIESEIHSGWYFINNENYYLFTNPLKETKVINLDSATPEIILSKVPRQGAPVIVQSAASPNMNFKQISFPDEFNNTQLSFTNVEYIVAQNENKMFVGYQNIYNIKVEDLVANETILSNGESTTNQISFTESLVIGREYKVSYKVRNSYYIDNEYYNTATGLYSKIIFNSAPTGASSVFYVTYETGIFDSATPTGLVHSPLHSLYNEGHIYIDENIYPYKDFAVNVYPGTILDNPQQDYMTITVQSFDSIRKS